MKKLYTLAICILAMTALPAVVFAGDKINKDTPQITNDGAGSVGPATVAYNPSPNVEIDLSSTTTGYAMTSANTLTDTTNGKEYATHNLATGYAMRTKTTIPGEGPEATSSADLAGIPDGDWVWMGGGSGS